MQKWGEANKYIRNTFFILNIFFIFLTLTVDKCLSFSLFCSFFFSFSKSSLKNGQCNWKWKRNFFFLIFFQCKWWERKVIMTCGLRWPWCCLNINSITLKASKANNRKKYRKLLEQFSHQNLFVSCLLKFHSCGCRRMQKLKYIATVHK